MITEFDCIDGFNTNLTWKINLYADEDKTSSLGCVVMGHDPGHFGADGCLTYSAE